MIQKGKGKVGRMGVILRDSHLDTRIEICMYPVERDRTKPRVCRSQGGKKNVGGEVGISVDVSGKEDARMFESHKQDSTESRVGNVLSLIHI